MCSVQFVFPHCFCLNAGPLMFTAYSCLIFNTPFIMSTVLVPVTQSWMFSLLAYEPPDLFCLHVELRLWEVLERSVWVKEENTVIIFICAVCIINLTDIHQTQSKSTRPWGRPTVNSRQRVIYIYLLLRHF